MKQETRAALILLFLAVLAISAYGLHRMTQFEDRKERQFESDFLRWQKQTDERIEVIEHEMDAIVWQIRDMRQVKR
jgi:hypothetical protein